MCIRDSKKDVEVRQGDFSAWWRDKQARDDWERAENSRLKKEIGRLEDAARRTASWSDRVEATKKGSRNAGLRPDRGYIGHKAAKMMKRSKAAQARREEAVQAKSAPVSYTHLPSWSWRSPSPTPASAATPPPT